MNLKYKLETCSFDGTVSTVTIKTNIGCFTGKARLHEEDAPYSSRIFGCHLAELKATEKYCKAMARMIKREIKALQDFWKDMDGTRTYSPDAYYVKKLRATIKRKEAEVKHWLFQAEQISLARKVTIEARDAENKTLQTFKDKNR